MPDNDIDVHQRQLFEKYERALASDPASPPPRGLDADLTRLARILGREFGGREMHDESAVDPVFVSTLRRRLNAEATRMLAVRAVRGDDAVERPRRPRAARAPAASRVPRRWALGWLGLAAVLVLALLASAVLWAREPEEVSAKEIVQRAQQRLNSPATDITSFTMTEVSITDSGDEQRRTETTYWYEAPDRWRIESELQIMTASGAEVSHSGSVGNGGEVWRWSGDEVARDDLNQGEQNLAELLRFGGGFADLGSALEAASECYTPARLDDEAVAGRAAFVIDLGATQCPSASMPETNGRRVIWLDQETFFVLKTVQYDGRPGREGAVLTESEVTQIDYNVDLPDERFAFATSTDMPDQASQPTLPALTPVEPPTLATFREAADYPIFVPTYLPEGLEPGPPSGVGGVEPGTPQVRIIYRTPDGEGELSVLNGPPDCCLSYKEGIAVTLPNGLPAHQITGQPGSGAGILWWEQDGTYVSIMPTGLDLTQRELFRIAASMSSTAGLEPATTPPSEAPSPTATPSPAAESGLGFPVLRPAWLPDGVELIEERRSDGRGGTVVVFSFDHRPAEDGHAMMTLMEQAAASDNPDVIDPQATIEQVDGRPVTVTYRNGACTDMTWVQDGTLLSLTNAYDPPGDLLYSCEQMHRVVASVDRMPDP